MLLDSLQAGESLNIQPPQQAGQPYSFDEPPASGLILPQPSNITTEIQYDPETGHYVKIRKMGDRVIGRPVYMSFTQFMEYDFDRSLQNYWKEKARPQAFDRRDGVVPEIFIGGELFDRIFGGSTIDIRPTGSAELIFGIMSNRRDDPALDEKRRRTTNFDFQQKIQLNVQARIGEKIEINSNYNTEATFDFENRMKLEYRGTEDEILQLLEAGDVTLPLPGTLITGTQGLFGFKSQMRFGNTTVTSVFSQQKTETSTIVVAGGAQTTQFEIKADQYEENRHYFIGQFFRNGYDNSLSTLPIINSQINISRIEVWQTNVGAATENNRNIVAFADLGESTPYNQAVGGSSNPASTNSSNNLYGLMVNSPIREISQVNNFLQSRPEGFVSGVDYESIENARLLRSNEYTYNTKLGFISLNQAVNPDQVLAVAFQYTIIGDTTLYQVGEFSNDVNAPGSLIVKLLKSTAIDTRLPMWDLMMKNVYSLGAFQVNREEFHLNILYESEELGVPIGFFTEGPVEGEPIIRVMGLDRLNTQHDPVPDGMFDFLDNAATQGGTIQSSNGRIYFPVVEPFGSHLRAKLVSPELGAKYAFDSLYTSTKYRAQQFPEQNRFILEGTYRSSAGSDIPLNAMNVPPGSVVVTAGGVPLVENVDYSVDYTLGRVRIINEAIMNSGAPIRISLESASLFDLQTKTLLGTHIDHRISENFNVGATIMRLSERPLTQKVGYGDEPIANTIWGANTTYSTESLFLTRMLDKLPFFSSNQASRFTFNGEFAQLIPGHSRRIGSAGTSYIDDFEGAKSSIDLKSIQSWAIASTPQHQPNVGMFPEGAPGTELAFRFNVARTAWYLVDPLFTRLSNLTPTHIRNDVNQRSNHFVREVLETEIWPNKQNPSGIPSPIPIMNLAFYPSERGPYNYETTPSAFSRGMAQDGSLIAPTTRWGGMMRGLPTTDFEAANIEFIEFWMLDPFVYNPEHTGGDLYFNLGDVSEDVLRDGRKSFENGLPITAQLTDVDLTIWGRVPTIQAVVNAFDNNPESRQYQDVGLDGLATEEERSFFAQQFLNVIAGLYGTSSEAYLQAWEDPSADTFQYYRGSQLDAQEVSILDRYKRYNGLERNSPTAEQSPESYPTSATNLPNTEDINRDGTLNEAERYFQYRVSLRPQDMVPGQNYITDVMTANVRLANNEVETVRWYQFKIPLRDPNRQVVGNIQDFKSVRFMRMYLKGFEQPIITRFATLELVRGTWRTYDRQLTGPGEYVPIDNDDTSFEVFTVNLEENGQRQPVPYVLPPGIERETDLGTTTLQQRNEQALSLRAFNLKDGDARAVYKTADLDMRQYRRLRMFTHVEAAGLEAALQDDEVTVFIRLGTDFTSNYYEYEVPLKVTPWATSALNDRAIWPEENEFDIELELLQQLKMQRNILTRDASTGITLNTPFVQYDGNNKMTVIGTPTLSSVRVIMIGIRNPRKTFGRTMDDGMSKSAELWVNELRLYDFEDQGGWAATGRMNTTLADLGNLTLVGFMSTPGFGGIEQKVNERQKEQVASYDMATNLELGRFFPEDFGLRIPMHFSFSESFSDPQYNPLNPDILFKDDLNSYETDAQRDSIRHLAQDYTRRKSLNFTNVAKTSTGQGSPPRFWQIENLDVTYAFTELFARNMDIEYETQKHWRGALGYNFSSNPKVVSPFANSKLLSHNYLRLIRDFNFSFFPRMISFRTNLNRGYGESLMRAKSTGIVLLEPNYVKTFSWNRLYDIRWDLARSLKLEFTATNDSRIDEPAGRINRQDNDYQQKRDSIWHSIRNMGRTTFYNHRVNITYNLPINKLPLLDWVNINAGYSTNFDWMAAPLAAAQLGNTIENSHTIRLNANANLINLYNKVGYLRTINQRGQSRPAPQAGRPQQPAPQRQNTVPDERPLTKVVLDGVLRMIMGFRNLSINYTEGNGTRLPGFNPTPGPLGQNWSQMAPGLGFIFGSQEDIREQAAREGWISTSPMLNTAYTTNHTQNISARSQFEPIPHLRVEFTALRNYSRSFAEYFRIDSLSNNLDQFNPMTMGGFSISFLSLRTTFEKVDKRVYTSENFENFKDYRFEIANRLAMENPNWDGTRDSITNFPTGYGPTSQDVMISSFMAAYAGWDPTGSTTSAFLKIPMPNWRLTYDGLSRIPAVQRYFQSITIGHGYRSTFNIGSFRSDLRYRDMGDGYQSVVDMASGNFVSEFEIAQVSINEQFNPLINIDITWQNSLLTRFEYRKSRDISLSFANNQVTDVSSNEIIIGGGYRFRNLAFNLSQASGGRQRIQSDLVLRLDLSFRENLTVLRKLVENVDQISAGQQMVSINTSAEYQVSPRVNFRFFFDRIISNPFVSSQFPNTNTHAGFSLRFMLM